MRRYAVIAIEKNGRTLCSSDNDGLSSENVMSFSKYKRATITLTAGISFFFVLHLRKHIVVVFAENNSIKTLCSHAHQRLALFILSSPFLLYSVSVYIYENVWAIIVLLELHFHSDSDQYHVNAEFPRLHVICNDVEKVTLDVGSISSSPSSKSSDIVVLPCKLIKL